MKKLQELIGETNQVLESAGQVKLHVPITQTGALYEVCETTVGATQTLWRIQDIWDDYSRWVGIGSAVPAEIPGLPELFTEIREEATKIIAIHQAHASLMDNLTWLCFNHIIHRFAWQTLPFKGGLPRIQIEDESAVFQIDFPIAHWFTATAHRVWLDQIVDGEAFTKQPFSQLPPDIVIPDDYGSSTFVPATFDAWTSLLNKTPHNATKHTMFRSRTANILEDFRGMVEELMAA